MSVLAMYRDFRKQFPELAQAADIRHYRIWDNVEDETAYHWFESLAGAVNDQMGTQEQDAELASVFRYFEDKLQCNDDEIKHCIDASFVENLFWEVSPKSAATVWATMPRPIQHLFVRFHGRAPTTN